MAKPLAKTHVENPETSWLFNGFLIFSIGWMFLSMVFSGSPTGPEVPAQQASLISTK